MDAIFIYNWGMIAGIVSIIAFLAKQSHDSRRAEKSHAKEFKVLREEIHESEARVREEMHESETRVREEINDVRKEINESGTYVTEKIHESERRRNRDIRGLSDQVVEFQGFLKGSGALVA